MLRQKIAPRAQRSRARLLSPARIGCPEILDFARRGPLLSNGGLARFLADGVIDYVGRNDDQVKLRGVRIELGEIESVLLRHPSVRVHCDGDVEFLAAYVVSRADTDDKALSEHLHRTLPEHMLPAVFMFLDTLPLTPHGKVDRKVLPRLERKLTNAGFAEPRDALEETLATIGIEVLELERVGIHENFFELGGRCLLALKVISRIRKSLGIDLALAKLFDLSTIAGIAAEMRRGALVGASEGGRHV